MSAELKGFARDGTVYAAAQLLGKASGLVLLPLYAYQLSIEQYALYTVLIAVSDLCALLLGLGINAALARLYFEKPDDASHQNRVVGTVFASYIGFAGMIGLAAALLSPLISKQIFGENASGDLFALTIVAVLLIVVFELTSGYYVVRKKPFAVLALSVGKLAALLGFNILMVVMLDLGVRGIVLAMALSFAAIGLPSVAIILRRSGLHFDRRFIADALRLGLPMVPSAAANGVIKVVERQLLITQSALAAALFGLADRLISLMNQLLAAPFSKVFLVRRFETLSRDQDQADLARVLLLFVALLSFASVSLVALGPEVLVLVAPEAFAPALRLMPWLAIGYACASLTVNMEVGLLYAKKSWIIPVIGIGALALSVACNVVAIPRYGPLGAALTAIIVSILRLVATIIANARFGTATVTAPWGRIALIMGTALLMGLMTLQAPFASPGWWSRLGRVAIAAAFMGLTILGPGLDRTTRHQVFSVVGALLASISRREKTS